jgi:hypothetical protein
VQRHGQNGQGKYCDQTTGQHTVTTVRMAPP